MTREERLAQAANTWRTWAPTTTTTPTPGTRITDTQYPETIEAISCTPQDTTRYMRAQQKGTNQ